MKLGLDEPVARSPGPASATLMRRRTVVLSLLAIACLALGFVVDLTILIAALGLFNVGVVAFLLMRKDITWGFVFYLTTSIFFQYGFWIRLPGFPDLYPARIASMLLYLVFVIQILLSMRKVPRIGRPEQAMIAFLAILFVSIITSGQRPRWLAILNGYLYPFIFFYFARAVMTRVPQIKIAFGYLVFIGIYCGVMGVFEKMQWYELVFPKFIVDPSIRDQGLTRLGFRVRGIFLSPTALGVVITMGFFPAWLYLSRQGGIIPRVYQLILLFVTPLTVFFTQTRSVYLGFVSALALTAVFSRKLRVVSLGIVLAGMLGAFLNWDNLSTEDRDKGGVGNTETVAYRLNVGMEALEVFLDHPFFGCGFANFTTVAEDYRRPRDIPFFGHVDKGTIGESVSHNAFLTILAEEGLLGFIPYVLIFVFIFRATLVAYRRLPHEGLLSKDLAVCVWAAMSTYLLNAMFVEIRQFEYLNVLLFFLMGALLGVSDRVGAGGEGEGEPSPPPPMPPARARLRTRPRPPRSSTV